MKTLSKKLYEKAQKHFTEKFGKKLNVHPIAIIEDFLINKTMILFSTTDSDEIDARYIKVCIYADNTILSVRYPSLKDMYEYAL